MRNSLNLVFLLLATALAATTAKAQQVNLPSTALGGVFVAGGFNYTLSPAAKGANLGIGIRAVNVNDGGVGTTYQYTINDFGGSIHALVVQPSAGIALTVYREGRFTLLMLSTAGASTVPIAAVSAKTASPATTTTTSASISLGFMPVIGLGKNCGIALPVRFIAAGNSPGALIASADLLCGK